MPESDDPSGGPSEGPSVAPSASGTARDRVRRELTSEIKEIALAQLASGGGAALSLRAIAREMGMASSALFRYFDNRDALLTALIIDSYSSLAQAAETAEAQVHEGSIRDRWMAIAQGVRSWAVAHPHEYALIFGSPIPGYAAPPGTIAPASRVPLLLGDLLGDLMHEPSYDVDAHPEPSAAVQRAIQATYGPGEGDWRPPKLPVAERVCATEGVWLPQNLLLGTREDLDDVVMAIEKIQRYSADLAG